jgi:hypothetical protein
VSDRNKKALSKLEDEIRYIQNSWIFPVQDSIQGFLGTDPIFIVGDQPSKSLWGPEHPSRKAFYETLQKAGAGNAHLTDLYKKRGECSELRNGLPRDFGVHIKIFRKEIEILQPTRIVALGYLAERLLFTYVPEHRHQTTRMWHFSYVVRNGLISEYEKNMRTALWGKCISAKSID